jgi:hypothetical protein
MPLGHMGEWSASHLGPFGLRFFFFGGGGPSVTVNDKYVIIIFTFSLTKVTDYLIICKTCVA